MRWTQGEWSLPPHHRTIKLEVKDKIGRLRAPRTSANGRPGIHLVKGGQHLY